MSSLVHIFKEMMIGALSCLLVVSMVGALYMPGTHTERAEAGGGIVYDPTNWIQNSITAIQSTVSAVANAALRMKELVLDPIAWTVANMVIQRMTQDVVSWINSGFQGQPAFMRDFGGFLTDIADDAVGEFIGSNETLRFLCSPFQLNIRATLSLQYAKSRNYGSPGSSCTLSGVTANLDRFFDGNAVAGGWDQWFKVTQDPQYNPYGALLLAQEQMSVRIGNTKIQQKSLLDWGDGFLSSQDCQTVENRKICRTVTPGTTIEEALNDALGSPSRRIAAADEINEILVALFTQLVNSAFSGAGGLLGLTGGGGGAQGSTYFTTLTQATINSNPITGAQNPLQTSITNETTYRNLAQSIVNDILAVADYKQNTYGSDSCHSGNLSSDLESALIRAQTELAISINSLATLISLQTRYNTAVGQPNQLDLQNQVLQEYLQLQSSGTLHTEPDIQTIRQTFRPQIDTWISDLQNDIDAACYNNQFTGQ